MLSDGDGNGDLRSIRKSSYGHVFESVENELKITLLGSSSHPGQLSYDDTEALPPWLYDH